MVKGKNQVHGSSERGGVGEGGNRDGQSWAVSFLALSHIPDAGGVPGIHRVPEYGMFLHKCILSMGPISAISILTISSI